SAVAAPALLELSLHRRAPIRAKAIEALGALKIKAAQSALLYALDDPSADVRASAVRSLASVGTSRALPALLIAAEHGVSGAWQSVGAIASPSDSKRLLEHAAAGDITPIRPALDAMMARSTFDLDGKLRIVQALEALGSPSARACLEAWAGEGKIKLPARLQQALVASLKRLDDGARTPGAVGLSLAAHSGKPNQTAAAEAPNEQAVVR
ncbi:MAG TPA: HEAT repeat domain-containing protein, partial [Polyangiales bacterium]